MMATPESIAALIENQSLMDRYLDYIQGDLTAQQVSGGDPLKKALRGISEFIPGISTELAKRRGDKFGEALSYLDLLGPTGAGLKMAVIPAVAKLNDQIKKLRFDYRREMRNADSGDGQFAIDAANKIERKIKTLTNKRDKAISNIKDPGERKAAELSTINIFHGSPTTGIEKGIGTLKLPKELDYLKTGQRYPSTGGIYSVVNPADPRLKSFSAKGSAYRISPNFNRTLDIENMPSDVRDSLDDMLQYISRPSRDTGNSITRKLTKRGIPFSIIDSSKALNNLTLRRMQYQLDTMLEGGAGSVNKTPAQFSEDIANQLMKKDYDSILFPPRKFKGEGETVLALNPEALNITGEIPADQLDDFIRAYLNFDPTKKLSNGGPTGDRVEVLGVEALEFPEDLIEYLPPDTEMSMKVGDKYYSRPEDYDALVAEARLEQYAQSQGRNDPDVKFGNNPQFDKKANISGTGIEEAGRNPEYNPDGSFAQEPNIYRYEYDETGKLLQNENYLIGEQSPTMGYYDENADTFVMPGEYGIDAYPKGYNKTTEAHEMMHRALPGNFSDEISAGNEHLYIADKTNDPEQFEKYRLEHYPYMPKRLFDVYYKNVIKRYYDNKFE